MRRGFLLSLTAALSLPGLVRAADCNANGVDDLEDIRSEPLGFEAAPVTVLAGLVRDIAAGDFDGDGREDIAAATESDSEVVVLLQRGDNFARGPHASLPVNSFAMTRTDIDRDGDQDLVIAADAPGGILVARNAGPGAGLELQESGVSAEITDIVAADLDADGDADAAGTSSFGIVLLENDDSSRLTRGADIPIGSHPVALLAADLDGDGDVDLATANTLGETELPGNISIAINLGGGIFAVPRNLAADSTSRAIAAVDANGDGLPELVAGGRSVEIYGNLGNGTFSEAERLVRMPAGSICILDADEDGEDDIAVGSSERRIRIFLREGDDGFRAEPPADIPVEPLTMVAADLDTDGDEDIAGAGGSLLLFFLESGRASGSYIPAGGLPAVHMAADMNGDGDADLVSADRYEPDRGFVRILENDGHARFVSNAAVTAVGLPYRMAMGDWEADADLDVAITTSAGSVVVFRNDAADLVETATLRVGGNVTALAAGDVDADSWGDLVVGSDQEGLTIFSNQQSTFMPAAKLAVFRMIPYFTAVADLDADGSLDLVSVTGDTHRIVLHWNEGGGSFRQVLLFAGPYPRQVVASDLDGDGDLDIATVNSEGQGARIVANEGQRRFVPRGITPAGSNPTTIVASDVDADSDVDLVCGGSELSLVVNEGGGTFTTGKAVIPLDGHTTSLSTADFDGDGALDIGLGLSSLRASGITLFLGRSREAASLDVNGDLIPDECQASAFRRGDADGTGVLDLSDALAVLRHLFLGDPSPSCLDAADADDTGDLTITDGVYILDHLFLGGPPTPSPGPPPGPCGLDPPRGSSLGCLEYPGC